METSLRYNDDAKTLILHAKQNLQINSRTPFQPFHLAANLGMGLQFDKSEKLWYVIRAKIGFPMLSDGLVRFTVKGQSDVDKDMKQRRSKGAAELSWSVFNFQKDQDVRVKLGYDIVDKVPYTQIRENNWSVNADAKGRWNIRYDL